MRTPHRRTLIWLNQNTQQHLRVVKSGVVSGVGSRMVIMQIEPLCATTMPPSPYLMSALAAARRARQPASVCNAVALRTRGSAADRMVLWPGAIFPLPAAQHHSHGSACQVVDQASPCQAFCLLAADQCPVRDTPSAVKRASTMAASSWGTGSSEGASGFLTTPAGRSRHRPAGSKARLRVAAEEPGVGYVLHAAQRPPSAVA